MLYLGYILKLHSVLHDRFWADCCHSGLTQENHAREAVILILSILDQKISRGLRHTSSQGTMLRFAALSYLATMVIQYNYFFS